MCSHRCIPPLFHDLLSSMSSIISWLPSHRGFHHSIIGFHHWTICTVAFSTLLGLITYCEFDNEYDIDFVLKFMCVHDSHFVQVVVHPFWPSTNRRCRLSTQTLQGAYMCTCWYSCEISATPFVFTVGISTWVTLLMLLKELYMVSTTSEGRLVDATWFSSHRSLIWFVLTQTSDIHVSIVVKWACTSVCVKAVHSLDTAVDDVSDCTGDRVIGMHAHRLSSITELDAGLPSTSCMESCRPTTTISGHTIARASDMQFRWMSFTEYRCIASSFRAKIKSFMTHIGRCMHAHIHTITYWKLHGTNAYTCFSRSCATSVFAVH